MLVLKLRQENKFVLLFLKSKKQNSLKIKLQRQGRNSLDSLHVFKTHRIITHTWPKFQES